MRSEYFDSSDFGPWSSLGSQRFMDNDHGAGRGCSYADERRNHGTIRVVLSADVAVRGSRKNRSRCDRMEL
jgi:hypothetical protein